MKSGVKRAFPCDNCQRQKTGVSNTLDLLIELEYNPNKDNFMRMLPNCPQGVLHLHASIDQLRATTYDIYVAQESQGSILALFLQMDKTLPYAKELIIDE